jgi:hypothetical protein
LSYFSYVLTITMIKEQRVWREGLDGVGTGEGEIGGLKKA